MNVVPFGGQINGDECRSVAHRRWVVCSIIGLLWAAHIRGAELRVQGLHNFETNPKNPQAGLVQAGDGNFYGVTAFGGADGENGTVFTVTPNGALDVLFSFDGANGSRPVAALVQARDGNLYGTTASGGTNGDHGTVYRISPTGLFQSLFAFNGSNGSSPMSSLVQTADGRFYGTTAFGGTNGDHGTIFRISTNGVFTSLFSFAGRNGSAPTAGLIEAGDGNLYGTTSAGGSRGDGTVFRITTNGVFVSLFSFDGRNGSGPGAGLEQAPDGTFFGTTQFGGDADNGTIFRITTNGAFTMLYSFRGADGSYPLGVLRFGSDGDLYGTTSGDKAFEGTNNFGTVFRMTPAGALTTLAVFDGANGASPVAGLALGKDGNFYGTTFEGGPGEGGTIFRLVHRPRITSIVESKRLGS